MVMPYPRSMEFILGHNAPSIKGTVQEFVQLAVDSVSQAIFDRYVSCNLGLFIGCAVYPANILSKSCIGKWRHREYGQNNT